MAAASGGLVFAYGVGAVIGPIATGQMMESLGPKGFWVFLVTVFASIALYTGWRITREPELQTGETGSHLGVQPTTSPVTLTAAQEWYADQAAGDAAEESLAACDDEQQSYMNSEDKWAKTLKWVSWYNTERLHSAIGYSTPQEAEEKEAFYENWSTHGKAA